MATHQPAHTLAIPTTSTPHHWRNNAAGTATNVLQQQERGPSTAPAPVAGEAAAPTQPHTPPILQSPHALTTHLVQLREEDTIRHELTLLGHVLDRRLYKSAKKGARGTAKGHTRGLSMASEGGGERAAQAAHRGKGRAHAPWGVRDTTPRPCTCPCGSCHTPPITGKGERHSCEGHQDSRAGAASAGGAAAAP